MPSVDPRPQSQCSQHFQRQQARRTVNPKTVVSAFNTWAFKREQPSDVALLHAQVEAAIADQRAIEFVLYWGKGPRNAVAKADIECLDYLQALAERINAVYSQGAQVCLIFTDTHASLNGHLPVAMDGYFGDIEAAGSARGFVNCRLGALVEAARAAGVGPASGDRSADTLEQLTRSAARWYRGGADPAAGAVAYYDMNMIEKRAVQQQFPGAVFITFNGSEFRELFPDQLPVFYMYSLRKGFGVKPWFLDEELRPHVLPPLRGHITTRDAVG
jgi:L-tyrosine isonitrile synthase